MDICVTMQNGNTQGSEAPLSTWSPPESLQPETPSGSESSSGHFFSHAESSTSGGYPSHSMPTIGPQVAEMGPNYEMYGYQYDPHVYHQTPEFYYVHIPQYDNGYVSHVAYIEYRPQSYSTPPTAEMSTPNNYGYQQYWEQIYQTPSPVPPPPYDIQQAYQQEYPDTTQPQIVPPVDETGDPSRVETAPDPAPSNPGSTVDRPIPPPEQIRHDAEEAARKYEESERSGTDSWSPHERITMLDETARTKFLPNSSPRYKRRPRRVEISTIFIVLLHHIPPEERVPRKDDGPVPCFQTMGDLVDIISGVDECGKPQGAPKIEKRLEGRIAMCGYGRDSQGRRVAKVIRGEQDVGLMYDTLVNYVGNR